MIVKATYFLVRCTAAALFLGFVFSPFGCSNGLGKSRLEGTNWMLIGWSISSLSPSDFEITAHFADGQISGQSAVNSYSGHYTSSADGDFSVKEIASTLMAGPEPAMHAEAFFFELLTQARTYSIEADELTLIDASGNPLLIFAPEK